MTRYCSVSIMLAKDWDSVFLLDDVCQQELVFWYRNASKLNIKYIDSSGMRKSYYVVYLDASGTRLQCTSSFQWEKGLSKGMGLSVHQFYVTRTDGY